MKQKEITAINVDDYIREQKRAGKKSIRWGKNGLKFLRCLARVLYHDSGYRFPRNFPKGHTFMGIRHFRLDKK